MVVVGDSIAEGHPGTHGRLHPGADVYHPDYSNISGQLSYGFGLSNSFNKYTFNHGIGGQRSDQIWARWNRDVLAQEYNPGDGRGSRTLLQKPEIVVISVGTNDIAQNVSLSTIEANITNMVESALDNGIKVVLLNVPPFSDAAGATLQKILDLNSWSAGLPIAYGDDIYVYDFYTAIKNPSGAGEDPTKSADEIHPTVAYYNQMAIDIYNGWNNR